MGSRSRGRVEGLRKNIPEATNGNNPRELCSEQVGYQSIKQYSEKNEVGYTVLLRAS